MNGIKDRDFVLVIVSDGYLKSQACIKLILTFLQPPYEQYIYI